MHITVFKEDIYTIQKYNNPVCAHTLLYGKVCYFQEKVLWGMY